MIFTSIVTKLPKQCKYLSDSVKALAIELDYEPYFDWRYQFDNFFYSIFHLLRASCHLFMAVGDICSILNPMTWITLDILYMPVSFALNMASAAISLVTAAIQPVMYVLRSLVGLSCGLIDSPYDWFSESGLEWATTEDEAETNASDAITNPAFQAVGDCVDTFSSCFK